MLNALVYLKGTDYTNVNAFVMYRPYWMPPRVGPIGDGSEVHFWQERVRYCTNAGRLWQDFADATQKGPSLGLLLECVAAGLAADGRHHKGLLAFYQQHPLPDRYLPSCL